MALTDTAIRKAKPAEKAQKLRDGGRPVSAVAWAAPLALIALHHPKMGRPRRLPYPLAMTLRVHFLQQWYALSDPAMEEALYDICGDSGYTGADKREELQHVDAGFLIVEKPSNLRAMKNKRECRYAERWEHHTASVRAKVEHPFRVVKRQFGYAKVRCRGPAKNTAQVLTLFALCNMWMVRRQLLPAAG